MTDQPSDRLRTQDESVSPAPSAVAAWWSAVIAPILSFVAGLALLAYGAKTDSGESLAAATVLLTASGAQTAHKILKGGPE